MPRAITLHAITLHLACLCPVALACVAPATAHDHTADFPDLDDGRQVLAVDLHTHSVFSDGQVWPSVRVDEAVRDGLDALAQTEHLEYQRHEDDIPHPDRNRSHLVALEHGVQQNYEGLILINGAEITRDMPPGHVNAVFLSDVNAVLTDTAQEALDAAHEQGAFIFWNHPHWLPQAPDGVARITDMHVQMIADGKLHGIEVANGTLDAYSEDALGIAIEHGLTILGTSDIHGLVDWTHNETHEGHRPMTLAFVEEKSPETLKQALFDGHTVAWHYDYLIGLEEHVRPLVQACLSLEPGDFARPHWQVLPVTLRNVCPTPFTLRNTGEMTFQNVSDLVRVEKNATYPLQVRMGVERETVELTFEVLNTQVRPREHAVVTLSARRDAE